MLKKMRDILGKITRAGIVDEKLVKETVKDIQRILIQSDVNVKLVKELSKQIESKALKEKLPPGLSRREHLTKLIYDELVKVIGGESYQPKLEPHKILLLGLYGSGKTTTAGKISRFYSKRGLKTAMICTDTWRPAAYQQLKQVGEQVKTPAYGDPKEKDALKLLKQGLSEFKDHELIIVDSAGRDSLNAELIKEIAQIKNQLKPEETYLVISADIGQTALKQAEEFNKAVNLTGVIVTKADASGKAGGALSACAAADVPIAFIGTGEKMDDFEVYDGERFISRLLGFPDIGTLMKKVKEAAEEAEFSPEDILQGEYNLKTFYKQLEAMKKMGPLKKVFEMLGMGGMSQEVMQTSEEKLRKYKFILDSMTEKEKLEPETIKGNRIKRIAKGSGTTEADVRELIKQYNMSAKMIKKLKRGKMKNLQQMMKKFQGGGQVKYR